MKTLSRGIALISAFLFFATSQAIEYGTQAEAKAMAIQAAALVEEVGMDKAREIIHDPSGPFIEKDLYVFAYNNEGVAQVFGAKPHLVGKNLYNYRDVDGNYLVQQMLAVKPGTAEWIRYKWQNAVTKVIDNKISYVIREKDYFIAVGSHDVRTTQASAD